MPDEPRTPSTWQLQETATLYLQIRAAVEADTELDDDETETAIARELAERNAPHPEQLIDSLISAVMWGTARGDEADALARLQLDRRDRYRARVARWREWIASLLHVLDSTKYRGRWGRVHFGGEHRALLIDQAKVAAFADEYVRIIREPNRTAIREALENGAVIDGAELAPPHRSLVVRKE